MKSKSQKPLETAAINKASNEAATDYTDRIERATATSKHNLQQHLMDNLEVMTLFRICRGTLYNWRKQGLIAFSKIGGRTYFESTEVYKMLQERKQRNGSLQFN